MDQPTQVVPEPAPVTRSHDPLAVALANASLLSAGYLMLGRRKLAVVTGLVTVVLVVLLVSVARSVWFEVVVLGWWAALIAHGWFLGGGRNQPVAVRRQRLLALGVAVPVLLAVGLLRFDTARIERTVTEARHSGDCAQALTALDRVWLGHRVADAPLTARGERTVQACQRLQTAKDKLTTALNGDTDALKVGFDGLASVLAELPGHEKMVDVVLDGFLGGLPAKNPCHTVAVTDWLRQRQASNNALDRSADIVVRTAPAALVGCGDDLMAATDLEKARTRYQQLLDQYPGDELAAKAQEGITQATLAVELANVRSLLEGSTSTQPEYCSKPAKYSGAAPYGKGRTNHALFYGVDEYTSKLPANWRAADAAQAVLVICVDEKEYGTRVRTCPYESKSAIGGSTDVTFRKIAIPVKAYELRTGKLVVDTKVQIGGASCPKVLSYTTYITDFGPPSEVYVTDADADVRAGFGSLITP
jgi:hypothetical protein